ncbi:Acyltransferase [Cupriavidus necator]|uniref:Outer membrane lipoprotein carrier protein LolA n=1 Tax=Cupriavidus necator (strain ATCC 17699 / DSM 428 / KCTC 22496 / NCIMB 10442 / H16 / Stanier 337) TaxID=381666 RepID=Q0K0M5_CUPNH|nr:LolA-related protein [Cupriavidus necator]QCC04284.1 outer membrane lipoprotein carrier protein LolA [Cupriavidus necator H16]QQB78973.1 outer membrane lipoprotein carrier protein LolA [Cupriavidus necator]WKA43191.1 outer-membrane lipoprotein carrier protein LolA [Cupriavidus necator]CAJ96449.1 putative fatty acyl CoA synthetase [Cupriavidus necator H16]
MPLSRRPFRFLLSMLLAGAMLALATPSGAATFGVDQLMSTLAQRKSGRVLFTETKYLAIVDKPVQSSGELLFTAPDHLEKRTLSPKAENMVLDGDMLTVERDGKRYTMPLQNYPELAAFIESIRGTLAGNRQTLERYYKLGLEGRASRWTLTLTPADSRMAAVVSQVRIDGSQDALDRVEIRQADGDRSVMKIRPAGRP